MNLQALLHATVMVQTSVLQGDAHSLVATVCDASHQNTVGTQAGYEGTKTANESSKSTKYCAQQQKWYMN